MFVSMKYAEAISKVKRPIAVMPKMWINLVLKSALSIKYIVIALILLSVADIYAKDAETVDFAAIALEVPVHENRGIKEIVPPDLPEIELEAEENDEFLQSPKYKKMSTEEELDKAVDELYKYYAPFLQDHTPAKTANRSRWYLDSFQFRMAEELDKKDLKRVLEGDGDWEDVKIPHYRGPNDWWTAYYRKILSIPQEILDSDTQILHFNAVSYSCKIYLNGRHIGGHTGWLTPFEIDLTGLLSRDKENVLIVEIHNEKPTTWDHGKLAAWYKDGRKIYAATGPGWDDPYEGWHTAQSGAGIWQKVYIEGRPKYHVTDIFVRPNIDSNYIYLKTTVYNPNVTDVPIKLYASIYPKNFEGEAVERIEIPTPRPLGAFYNEYRVRIQLSKYKLWKLDEPFLYTMRIEAVPSEEGVSADHLDRHFGMRTFVMDEENTPKGTLYLNNEKVILRGANTMGHLQVAAMRDDYDRVIKDILIAKACNLNFWRFTQKAVQPEVYDICDKLGILTQTDLPLMSSLSRQATEEAIKQCGEIELLVRNHPCNIMISFMNEPFDAVKKGAYSRHLDRDELLKFYSAASELVRIYNPDRVIKPVDGDYDPPHFGLPDVHCYNMWYANTSLAVSKLHKGYWVPIKLGWKWGCGEYGAEALECADTMYKYYPKYWLPEKRNDVWKPEKIYLAQTWRMHGFWFDEQDCLDDWIEASQTHQAFATRVMTRAFRRQKDCVSSVIHLLIDAWPAGWMKTLMDVDRVPKKALFEYKDALTPLMVDMRTDRTRFYSGDSTNLEFWVCNDKAATFENGTIVWEVWDQDKRIFAQTSNVEIPSFAPKFVGYFRYKLPDVKMRMPVSIRVSLMGPNGNVLHASEQQLDVFPKFSGYSLINKNVQIGIIGKQGGRAWKTARMLGANPCLWDKNLKPRIIFIDDANLDAAVNDELTAYLEQGGLAVLFEQRSGELQLCGQKITIERYRYRDFVSRRTGHKLVEGFDENDFAYWYYPPYDRIEHVCKTVISCEDIVPILITSHWSPVRIPVVGEINVGKGKLIINQLSLSDRLKVNPIVFEFYNKIINYPNFFENFLAYSV